MVSSLASWHVPSSSLAFASPSSFARRARVPSRPSPPQPYPALARLPQYASMDAVSRRQRRQRTQPLLATLDVDVDFGVDAAFPGESSSPPHSPLAMTLSELSEVLEGSGRARAVWDCLREGIDPNVYYTGAADAHSDFGDFSDAVSSTSWSAALESTLACSDGNDDDDDDDGNGSAVHTPASLFSEKMLSRGLGRDAYEKLQNAMRQHHPHGDDDNHNGHNIENTIACLSHATVSPDGTVKLLSKMVCDGLEVESVIIPWFDKGHSTLCVSSQVGCKQGCTFCATGRMGKLRSLTADEIVVQAYLAAKFRRATLSTSLVLPPIDNVVFMGMGEPADNADSVLRAANLLVDRFAFGLAQGKVTISTVAPNPESFTTFGEAPAALAWSVHAADDVLRRKLVPTMRYSVEELRQGLIAALMHRSNKLRKVMLEAALIHETNDSPDDAVRMADLAASIMKDVPGCKAVVNLIPFNDIGHPTHRVPTEERVAEYQRIVAERGVLCYVRTTRGDGEAAACGQLATKRRKVTKGI